MREERPIFRTPPLMVDSARTSDIPEKNRRHENTSMTEATTLPRKTRELQTRVFDSTIWNEFRYRDDDIVIAMHPKAGTTWMQRIVAQLLFRGDPDLEVGSISPWQVFFHSGVNRRWSDTLT